MIKVGVIFGGETVEHEISIITAVQAMSFIDTTKYEVVPIYISKDRNWYTGELLKDMSSYKNLADIPLVAKEVTLTKKDDKFILQKKRGLFKGVANTIDVAFPIVHGKGVEDGSISGFLEILKIPYTTPTILGASISQDKEFTKVLLENINIKTVPYEVLYNGEDKVKNSNFPKIIKPARLGSSIGIKKVNNEEECIKAGKTVCCYTTRALITADTGDKEDELRLSVKISDAVQSLVGRLSITPSFVIAKGGITSSDVGTKALAVKKANVLGQIKPGIPVWQTGDESKFPLTPYVIFPGNVGEITTLKEAVEVLMQK